MSELDRALINGLKHTPGQRTIPKRDKLHQGHLFIMLTAYLRLAFSINGEQHDIILLCELRKGGEDEKLRPD